MPTVWQPAAAASAATTDESTPPDMATATRRPAKGASTSRALAGSCNVPLGGFAQISGANLRLRGYVGAPDGTRHVSAEVSGAAADAEALGMKLAQMLKGMGADSILAALALT